jgi:SEC-C motif domain protein
VRARFSAYAVGRVDYLWDTLHSGHDDRAGDRATYVERVERSLVSCRYRSLQILDSRDPDEDGMATVLFAATIVQHKRDLSVVEQSVFVQEDGQWRYIAGAAHPRRALSHALQDMRIDHWQCADHHHH